MIIFFLFINIFHKKCQSTKFNIFVLYFIFIYFISCVTILRVIINYLCNHKNINRENIKKEEYTPDKYLKKIGKGLSKAIKYTYIAIVSVIYIPILGAIIISFETVYLGVQAPVLVYHKSKKRLYFSESNHKISNNCKNGNCEKCKKIVNKIGEEENNERLKIFIDFKTNTIFIKNGIHHYRIGKYIDNQIKCDHEELQKIINDTDDIEIVEIESEKDNYKINDKLK